MSGAYGVPIEDNSRGKATPQRRSVLEAEGYSDGSDYV